MAAQLALANQHVCDDNPAAALIAFERSIQEAPTAAAYAGRAALHMAVAAQPEESGSRSGRAAGFGLMRATSGRRCEHGSHGRAMRGSRLQRNSPSSKSIPNSDEARERAQTDVSYAPEGHL